MSAIRTIIWLDALLCTLARARATLASFGVRDEAVEARIDGAMKLAHEIRSEQSLRDSATGEEQ